MEARTGAYGPVLRFCCETGESSHGATNSNDAREVGEPFRCLAGSAYSIIKTVQCELPLQPMRVSNLLFTVPL